MATNHNPERGPRTLSCEAWEAMLADALDGTLNARDGEAFYAHSQSCGAGCAELLEEAKRGSEWLRFLRQTPEAPEGLLEKILAGTTGVIPETSLPLAANGAVALARQPWLGVPMHLLQRHMAESRILMTIAMAFFSLALTLNLTGVRLNQLKLSDLKPSALATTLSYQYHAAYKNVAHYYLNLRIVYELESQVNEMRGRYNNTPASQPANQQPQQPKQQQGQPSGSGKPGGSARKGDSAPEPQEPEPQYEAPIPVLALFHPRALSESHTRFQMCGFSRIFSSGPELEHFSRRHRRSSDGSCGLSLRKGHVEIASLPDGSGRNTPIPISRPGNQHKPSERSLA